MKPWNETTHYAGFDWARNHHDVVIVDRQGQIVAEFRLQHTLEGWQEFGRQLKAYPALAVAIETSQHLLYKNPFEWWDVRDDTIGVAFAWMLIRWTGIKSMLLSASG